MNAILQSRNLNNRRWRLRTKLPMWLAHIYVKDDAKDGHVTIEGHIGNRKTFRHYICEY